MQEPSDIKPSSEGAAFAWLVNLGMFCCAVLVIGSAWRYTGGEINYRTVLLALGGVAALLVTAILILFWIGGADAVSRRRARSSD
jgi:hypothetical protein